MLESVVARILNNVLGKYLQELDTEGLNVGIFGGDVLLHGLKLKPSCLYELDLPIEVIYGVIGELKLVIPWSCLPAKPIQVIVEDVLIVAHPVGVTQFDAEREKQLLRALKSRVLEKLESGCVSDGVQSLLGILSPLLTHTVQVHVRGLHVRYEDPLSHMAAGIMLQEISIETTNSKWKPVDQQSGSSSYQLLRIDALAVYINTGLHPGQFLSGDGDWGLHMRNAMVHFQIKGAPLDFAVKPLNAKLKVIVGRAEGAPPPVLVDVVIQDAVLSLSHRQLTAINNAINLFQRVPVYREYLPLRPIVPVKSHSIEWWKYAYKACLEQRVKPYTWTRISAMRRSYREYKELYKQSVMLPNDAERKLDMQRSEDALPISVIVIARQQAFIELKNQNSDLVEVVHAGEGHRIAPIKRTRSLPQESVNLYFLEHKVNLSIDNLSMSLVRDGREVLCVSLTQGLASCEARACDAWKISARTGSLLVEGSSVDNELMPVLATPANTHVGSVLAPCFSLDVEKKGLDESETTDWSVQLKITPMELIYHEHAFSEILSWLPDFDWKALRRKTWQQAKNFASKSLVPRLDLHACIALPTIVLPEHGSLQKSGLVLAVDLGIWDINTDVQPRLTAEEVSEMTQMELEERLYHRLNIQCTKAQVLFTDSGEEWRALARRDESDAHILSHLRASITLSSSIKPDYNLLPKVKLNIGIPTIEVTLSERRCQQLLDVLTTLPMPSPRRVIFMPTPPLCPEDRVNPDLGLSSLRTLASALIGYELSRQRTHSSLTSPLAPSSITDVAEGTATRSVISDASEEEAELWARTVHLPGFEEHISPNNTINCLVRVTLGELVCNLPRSIGFQDKPYLMIRVARLSCDVALLQFGPSVQIAVGGVQLIDKLHIAPSGEYLEVVSTQSDQDLFSLLYRKVSPQCPDFSSHFHSIETSVVADVGRVSLLVQRDACLTMYKYIQDLTKKIADKIPSRLVKWCCSVANFVSEILRPESGVAVPTSGTKFNYSVHLSEFAIRLREADVDLLHLQLNGMEGDWTLRANDRLVLRTSLRSVSMSDVTEGVLYPHVITQDGDHVFEVKLVRLGTSVRRGLSSGTLKLSLARLHVLITAHIVHVLQRFVTLVNVFYLEHFLAKHLERYLPDWEGALQLSLSLHLPVILLPPSSSAPSLLIVHMGDLTVENFLKHDTAGNVVDNVLIRLENSFITRGLMTLSGNVESREEILEPVKVTIDAKRVLSAVKVLEVKSSVDTMRLALGQKDLSLLLHLYSANKSLIKLLDGTIRKREEPVELKSLQVFLRDGNAKRRDTSLTFTLDTFILFLYMDIDEQLSSPVRDQTHALCKLLVQDVICSVDTCVSGICELRLSIHNCVLDDVRSDPSVLVKRIFGPRPGGDSRLDSAISVSTPPLVDVVGKQSERGDTCIDVMVERTRLSLSAGFLAAFDHFCSDAGSTEVMEGGCDNFGYVGDTPMKTRSEGACCSDQIHDSCPSHQRGVSLSLQLRRPEVAVITEGGTGLVMRCEVLLDTSLGPGHDEMVLRLVGVRITSLNPAPMILRPCDVELVRKVTSSGIHVAVGVGALEVTLCSVAFAACSKILEEITSVWRQKREVAPLSPIAFLQLDDLWSPKKLDPFCQPSICHVAGPVMEPYSAEPHSFSLGAPAESLVVGMGAIKIVLGAQQGVTCRPMIIAKGECHLTAQDWTSAPSINSTITMKAACWNENLETWESLLEPWTISLDLYQNKALPISPCSGKVVRTRRSDDTLPVAARETSDSSGDESEAGMTFLKPEHFHLDFPRKCEQLSDPSGFETGEGALERLRGAVAHLFMQGAETSESEDGSSDEVETDSASSDTARSPATERAVFLNKHSDSVDSGLETETVDRQATHVLIQTTPLEISVTPNTLAAYKAILSQRMTTAPPLLTNFLGAGTKATLFKEGEVQIRCGFDDESPPGTPGSPSPCPSPSPSDSSSVEGDRVSPDFSFERPDLSSLKSRLSKKMVLVEIPGMEAQSLSVTDLVGMRSFTLPSTKVIILSTNRVDGATYHELFSPLSVRNCTSYPIALYYKKTALESLGEPSPSESSNPFDDMVRLFVVAPDDCFHVPLTVCYHCKLYFLPTNLEKHQMSEEGISWQEIKNGPDTAKDILCVSGASGESFCMQLKWNGSGSVSPLKEVTITPAWTVTNLLPCACELLVPKGDEGKRIRLEAGEDSTIYSINPRMTSELGVEVPDYTGQSWTGVLVLGPDCKDKVVVMETDKDTDGGNKHLAICVLVNRTAPSSLILYSPYWLLNKTGLPLQVRSSGSDLIQEWSCVGPLLFCHRKHRARTVRVRVLSSSWSPAFSLDAAGCSGLAVCRDAERKKKYRLVVQCNPCKVRPDLCRVITILPHLIVENATRKHLRFMEDNERADLWHDIAPGQSMPFWPDTDSLRMVVRMKDSKNVSQAFPMAQNHITALRMDKGCSLTVEVCGGEGTPLKVSFRPYSLGDAPVRIDNHCPDLFLKFRQRGCPQVALISPFHSLLYTWDDACKERQLLWSVYNNAGGELSANITHDACGEERISFRTVRTSQKGASGESAASSSSSDSEAGESPVRVKKNTRKDTVVVYWTSYLAGRQRVLLLTQDERLARKSRKAVDAERAHLEVALSVASAHISLSHLTGGSVLTELAYGGIRGAPARWDLCVGQRWKTLPLELAAWLENSFIHGALQANITDYIQVDFEKMQMSRPLFGSIRRRARPAMWVQYRSSRHLSVLLATVHRVQLDDQRVDAVVPCVLQAAPSAGSKPALEVSFLARRGTDTVDSLKYGSLAVQEHSIHIDSDWLHDLCTLIGGASTTQLTQALMRRDISNMHNLPSYSFNDETGILIEKISCSDIKLDVTLAPSRNPELSSAALPGLPDVFAGLISSVATAAVPVDNLPIKLTGSKITALASGPLSLAHRLWSHYTLQLLQQLYVLVQGVSVLATPVARLATRVETEQEELCLPEEFSYTVQHDLQSRLSINAVREVDTEVPKSMWMATRTYPLACSFGLSGLSLSGTRGPQAAGLDAFARGPGRVVCTLLSALLSEQAVVPDPLMLVQDAIRRCQMLGANVSCRTRPPKRTNPVTGAAGYSMVEGQGLALLLTVCRGRYCSDVYWAHAPLNVSHSQLLLISLQRVLYMEQIGSSNQLDVSLAISLDSITEIAAQNGALVITSKQGVETSEKRFACWDPSVLEWLHTRLVEARYLSQLLTS